MANALSSGDAKEAKSRMSLKFIEEVQNGDTDVRVIIM